MRPPSSYRMQGDMVLLKVEEQPGHLGSGLIHRPDTVMEHTTGTAVVLAVGPGMEQTKKVGEDADGKPIMACTGKRRPMDVKVGDRVALLWHHLVNMQVDDGVSVVAERDLWGVVLE